MSQFTIKVSKFKNSKSLNLKGISNQTYNQQPRKKYFWKKKVNYFRIQAKLKHWVSDFIKSLGTNLLKSAKILRLLRLLLLMWRLLIKIHQIKHLREILPQFTIKVMAKLGTQITLPTLSIVENAKIESEDLCKAVHRTRWRGKQKAYLK